MGQPAQKTPPEWLPLPAAAVYSGQPYELIRRLAKVGVFTRTTFSPATKRPPVYVPTAELDAFRDGGLEAVRKVQDAARRKSAKRKVKS